MKRTIDISDLCLGSLYLELIKPAEDFFFYVHDKIEVQRNKTQEVSLFENFEEAPYYIALKKVGCVRQNPDGTQNIKDPMIVNIEVFFSKKYYYVFSLGFPKIYNTKKINVLVSVHSTEQNFLRPTYKTWTPEIAKIFHEIILFLHKKYKNIDYELK